MKTILFLLALFHMAASLHAGWIVLPLITRIEYSERQNEGRNSFDAALKELADSGRIQALDAILATALLRDDTFQKELFSSLEHNSPRELKDALKSAGNMHNPKMMDLRKPFLAAVIDTPTVQKLNSALAPYGLRVTKANLEKLELRKTDTGRRFFCMLSLDITK